MEGEVASNQSVATLTCAEIIKYATMIKKGIKPCPLCRSEVRLLFINLNEIILMCVNDACEYPFCFDEVIYLKVNNKRDCSQKVASIRCKSTSGSTPTCSLIPSVTWSEIAQINRVNETEGLEVFGTREYFKRKDIVKKPNTCNKKVKTSEKILKKVEDIKKIQDEILEEEAENCLRNEKWIGNLMSKQEATGIVLLKPEEVNLFKKREPEIGLKKFEIDIDRGSKEGSLIKIEIANIKPDKTP